MLFTEIDLFFKLIFHIVLTVYALFLDFFLLILLLRFRFLLWKKNVCKRKDPIYYSNLSFSYSFRFIEKLLWNVIKKKRFDWKDGYQTLPQINVFLRQVIGAKCKQVETLKTPLRSLRTHLNSLPPWLNLSRFWDSNTNKNYQPSHLPTVVKLTV